MDEMIQKGFLFIVFVEQTTYRKAEELQAIDGRVMAESDSGEWKNKYKG